MQQHKIIQTPNIKSKYIKITRILFLEQAPNKLTYNRGSFYLTIVSIYSL